MQKGILFVAMNEIFLWRCFNLGAAIIVVGQTASGVTSPLNDHRRVEECRLALAASVFVF